MLWMDVPQGGGLASQNATVLRLDLPISQHEDLGFVVSLGVEEGEFACGSVKRIVAGV